MARNKGIKSALTLFAQDCTSKLILYTQADIRRREADDKPPHNPLLRAVAWNKLPESVSWLGGRRLRLHWQ